MVRKAVKMASIIGSLVRAITANIALSLPYSHGFLLIEELVIVPLVRVAIATILALLETGSTLAAGIA